MGKYNNKPNSLFKPPSRAEVDAFVTAAAQPSPANPRYTEAPPPKTSKSRSYADLLQRLYEETDRLADDLAVSDAPPHQRADALSKLARTLPLIAAAEAAAKHKTARGKDIAALTDAELEAQVAKALKKGDSPLATSERLLVPPPSNNKKNDSEALPTFPDMETEE